MGYYESVLKSWTCFCGKGKQAGEEFCDRCFRMLPLQYRLAKSEINYNEALTFMRKRIREEEEQARKDRQALPKNFRKPGKRARKTSMAERGLGILKLAIEKPVFTAQEVMQSIGMPRNSAYEWLNVACDMGMIEKVQEARRHKGGTIPAQYALTFSMRLLCKRASEIDCTEKKQEPRIREILTTRNAKW